MAQLSFVSTKFLSLSVQSGHILTSHKLVPLSGKRILNSILLEHPVILILKGKSLGNGFFRYNNLMRQPSPEKPRTREQTG